MPIRYVEAGCFEVHFAHFTDQGSRKPEHRERGVEIDKSTAVTRWAGERMDYSTAIEWLLCKDGVNI